MEITHIILSNTGLQKNEGKIMKKTVKILIAAAAVFLMIGIVVAADPVDVFKAPSGFTASGNDTFVDTQNHNIQIFNYTDELYKEWFKSDSTFSISNFKDNNFLTKNTKNHYGVLEIVEMDGNKYIIESWTGKNPNESRTLQNNLEKFNNANDLKPIAI